MNMYELISKVKSAVPMTTDEIYEFVKGVTDGSIPDYQISAWLMAVCFNSLSERETADLTMAMKESGSTLSYDFGRPVIDKHSTGGVGDKVTLIAAPAAAACGVCVAKMSGRGLGHTGGTIDKLEAIPDFRTALSYDEFTSIVRDIGVAVTSQTADLAPADKKLYALRNATATVDSIPLIASSIMSKKLATNPDGIVLDVKVGSGAFMHSVNDAMRLAETMISIGRAANKRCTALITDMSAPLGECSGNALEVIEACEILNGRGSTSLRNEAMEIASQMVRLSSSESIEACRERVRDAFDSGKAFAKLKEMVTCQGGDTDALCDYAKLPQPSHSIDISADRNGWISAVDAGQTGLVLLSLGAGRTVKDGPIDYSAGVRLHRVVGDRVDKGDRICTLYTSTDCRLEKIAERMKNCISLSSEKTEEICTIINVIND